MGRFNGSASNDKRKLNGFAAEIYEWMEAIAFALAIVVILFTFVFRVVSVSGGSMDSSLANGDRLLVNSLFYEPEQGDIVIVVKENEHTSDPIIKRIIACPGQTVRYDSSTCVVYINGQPLDESAYIDDDKKGGASAWLSEEVTLDEDEYIVMGDNRKISFDSRNEALGAISKDDILGEVLLRIYPFNSIGEIRG